MWASNEGHTRNLKFIGSRIKTVITLYAFGALTLSSLCCVILGKSLASLSFGVLVCKVRKTYLLLMGFVMFN